MNRLTTAEVAAALNVTERRVRQLALELGIKPERIGKALFWKPDDIRRMKKRKTQRGPAKKRAGK
jgi:hypothetical protein